MKKYLIILCLNLAIQQTLVAQGKITGNLVNNNKPVEFATVTISNEQDANKVLFYEATDSLGAFSFDKLDYGKYLVKVKLVGFLPISKTAILNANVSALNFKDLNLIEDASELSRVTVTAQKKMIEKTIEGFIINTANNITQIGGTATDLLKATPTVSVDNDGVITLRGKTPLILINGRNSSLANTDQIAASGIESIEIINNASSKYDANAESGIINIKLKKNKQAGTNGALALGGGIAAKGRINSSIILNNKVGKWNIGLGYDNRFAGRTRKIESNRTNYNLVDNYSIIQNRNDKRVEKLQNLKLNLDYNINQYNTISFEALGNMESQDNNEDLISKLYKKPNVFTSSNDRNSFEYEKVKEGEFALNYLKTYKNSKKTMNATISSSVEKGRQNTDIFTKVLNESLSQTGVMQTQLTHNYEDGVITNAKLDYYIPVSKNGVFETGYKGLFRTIKTDYLTADKINETYITNTLVSNVFNFNEQVQAFYIQYHNTTENNTSQSNWTYAAGLRAEQVNNTGETITQSTRFSNNYLKLFPTANLSFNINEKESFKLSYGKRINRPGLGQLNPFVDITDILSPHSGNPNLKPEIIDAYELSYNKGNANLNFTSSLFFRHSTNAIRPFYIQQSNGAILNMPMNIGNTDNYGLETMVISKPVNFYDFNASATLFQQKINGSNIAAEAVQSSMNWSGKLINNFSLSNKSKLQVIANYISPKTTPQGESFSLYNVDLGLQQKIGKTNFKMNFIVVDAFNTLKSGYNTQTSTFSIYRSQKSDTRAFMITLAYSFKSALKDKMLENKFNAEY
ncbi:MAG: TonB-dependent receptor [Sediminibacterium sp.]|nr:MAG: TonB-dependent receptor [Sediminibacterium sp.]